MVCAATRCSLNRNLQLYTTILTLKFKEALGYFTFKVSNEASLMDLAGATVKCHGLPLNRCSCGEAGGPATLGRNILNSISRKYIGEHLCYYYDSEGW